VAARRALEERPQSRGDGGGRQPRRALLILAGALGAAVVLVLAVMILGGGSGGDEKSQTSASRPAAGGGQSQPGTPVVRGQTTVAVLNGTTVPGLAAQVADELERGGFKRGSVTNAADQQRAVSKVGYASGYERAAREVGELIGVRRIAPVDVGTQAIAGPDANVVVTVGADRTQ
jgi:hypothetical protein